ncbi:MAG: late competence development ComFB family protein, partial [Oscillospiraceae bacterium]|nr:late competence development ComFB family protein [Oscillospiraceae bacterium]
PAPAPVAEEPAHQFLEPENPGYINVMQVLVEEKAPKYVEMFGLCTCKRCMEDVKAFTLNHLPPKYVVLEPGDRVPRLTVYEGKFSSDITAQLLQACKVIHETPHHSRT